MCAGRSRASSSRSGCASLRPPSSFLRMASTFLCCVFNSAVALFRVAAPLRAVLLREVLRFIESSFRRTTRRAKQFAFHAPSRLRGTDLLQRRGEVLELGIEPSFPREGLQREPGPGSFG